MATFSESDEQKIVFQLPPRPALGGLLGGLTSATLKKKAVSLMYTSKEMEESHLQAHWSMTATARMLMLDDYRKHSCINKESELLNLPQEKKLDIHSLKDILVICGGCAGSRFASEDFTFINKMTQYLVLIYAKIDNYFKETLQGKLKKLKLTDSEVKEHKRPQEADQDVSLLLSANSNNALEEKQANFESVFYNLTDINDEVDREEGLYKIARFHRYSDTYVRYTRHLQTFIKEKQDILSDAASKLGPESKFTIDASDPDGLGANGSSQPLWLENILYAYDNLGVPRLNLEANTSSVKQIPHTIGKISAYLGAYMNKYVGICVHGDDELNAGIINGFQQLLHASNDSKCVVKMDTNLESLRTATKRKEDSLNGEYWAQRFYNFLVSLSDLKSMPKEKDVITNIERFRLSSN